jgi:serine/threonine-protein kinase HipA
LTASIFLAPALFDVNPTPGDAEKYLATALDYDNREADPRLAFELADYFRVSASQARSYARQMACALRTWSAVAHSEGIDASSLRHMESCFQQGIRALESL